MRSFWQRLGATDSINLLTFIAVAYLQVLGAFIVSGDNIAGREWLFTACILISLVPPAATWLLGKYLIIPFVRVPIRPWVMLVIFESAAILRGISFDQALALAGLDSSQMLLRISGSQATWLVGAVLISNLVVLAREFSNRNENLLLSSQALTQSRNEVAARLQTRKEKLTESIRTQLSFAVAGLSGTDVAQDAVSLKSLIDDVVRPVSNQLGREFTASTPHELIPHTVRINWRQVVKESLADNPVHPGWLTAWIALGGIHLFTRIAGEDFLAPYLLAVATCFVFYLVLRMLWKRIPQRWGSWPRALLFAVAPLILTLVMNALLQAVFSLNVFTPRLLVSEALFFFGIAWAVALVFSAWRLLQRTNVELTAVADELRRDFVVENAAARSFEHAVARVLHGPIQDAIAASLRRIQQLPSGATLSSSDLDQIRAPILDALHQLQQPEQPSQPLTTSLTDLAALWSGAVDIESTIASEAIEQIALSEKTNGIVVEILREAISNAIRHGDASLIRIDVTFDDDASDLVLSVTNNGAPISSDCTPGIGTKLLNDFAHSWSRENVDGAVALSARIPA